MQTADCMTLETSGEENNHVFKERIPKTPPIIAPVAEYTVRPLWSIMIPVYNCLSYLQETLKCVLAQDAGPEYMQIVVVDDCSTDGDVGAMVQAIAGQRVKYFQQPKNQGSLRNFETCLNLATGYWVHILHGDDLVMPGFYREVEKLFHHYPEAGAAFTNFSHITSNNDIIYEIDALLNQPGIIKDFLVQNAQKLLVQPPAIVVKRAVYEQLGGFYAVHYGEDWEMWTRIAAYFPIAYSPVCLANYRYYTNNSITQLSIVSGQNVHDIITIIDIMQAYLPLSERASIKKAARREYALYCISLAHSLYNTNRAASLRQVRGALQLSTDIKVYNLLAKYLVRLVIDNKDIRKIINRLRPTSSLQERNKTD